jgi:hypothetical protein
VSDFHDYYDELCTGGELQYTRIRNNGKYRSEELKFLKDIGIKTVDFGPLRMFNPNIKKLVVYTDPKRHNFQGKEICSYMDAISRHGNCLVSEFIEKYNGYTVKYLQIGERRFRMMFLNREFPTKLIEGELVRIEELTREYNYGLRLPIYSIDYISNGNNEMLAVDFNTVQQLDKIGMDKYIKEDEVVRLIHDSLIAYNKA